MKKQLEIDTPEINEAAIKVADLLQETEPNPIACIKALIAVNGEDFVYRCLVEAGKRKHAGQTMKTDDQSRYRTFGGMFFKIAKNKMSSSKRYSYMVMIGAHDKDDESANRGQNGRK